MALLYFKSQYSRRETVELVGIPDSVDNKDLEDKVVQLINHAGVVVDKRSFHAVHRLKKKGTVIAKFVNRRDPIAILRAKRNLRELKSGDSQKLGVTKVYVNESLNPYYKHLFWICNKLYKEGKLQSSYTINGSIKVKIEGGALDGKTATISHIEDLYKLFGTDEIKAITDPVSNSEDSSVDQSQADVASSN